MKRLATTMLFVLLATPAFSQGLNLNMLGDRGTPKTQDEVDAEKARDSAYKSGLKKLPDQNAKVDPWGNIRGGGAAQTQKHAQPNAR